MTIANSFSHLHFPCACVSNVEENNTDPWAAIAKNGLLAGRTKEEIINLVAESPKTISQLAKALDLSAAKCFQTRERAFRKRPDQRLGRVGKSSSERAIL